MRFSAQQSIRNGNGSLEEGVSLNSGIFRSFPV